MLLLPGKERATVRLWRYFYLTVLWMACPGGAINVGAQQKPLLPPRVRAVSAILVEGDTGAVLLAKEPDRSLPPASTTKIVTGMLLARDVPPETLIPVSPQAAA